MVKYIFLLQIVLAFASSDVEVWLEKTSNPLEVTVTTSNSLSTPVKILTWSSILETNKDLQVRTVKTNVLLPFHGPISKRTTPPLEAYLTLEPKGVFTRVIDITAYRSLSAGIYQVEYRGSLFLVGRGQVEVTSNSLIVNVSSAVNSLHKRQNFNPCSEEQQWVIDAAWENFVTMAKAAKSRFSHVQSGDLETTYFGETDTFRTKKVAAIISMVKNLASNKATFSFSCDDEDCSSNTYAYVYPTDSTKTIHLCAQFWKAIKKGFPSSQPGTLYHEITHFKDVGATDDIRYGEKECEELAQNYPDYAIRNADNFEYYAESLQY